MHTVVESPTRAVHIGPDQPFIIIGERINPTGRKRLEAEMLAGDLNRVARDALAQVAAGAHILDVNVGVTSVEPHKTEPELMVQCIELIQSLTDVPLSIDSSVAPALIAGIECAKGRPLINSVTGEEERLETILPVVAEYKLPVIAICNDETGINYDPLGRFQIARKIVERAATYGIPHTDVLIDPLAMPVGAINSAGRDLFTIVRLVREELGCNTVCGASNISFGMPARALLNSTFLSMAIAAGMTSAITNPLEPEIRHAIYAADLLNGHDEHATRYLAAMRRAKAASAQNASTPPPEVNGREARAARRAACANRLAPGSG
jgi:5-methyltetrahydrofolate--homocysteine methyltransferase